MEDADFRAPKLGESNFVFPPHGRLHLRSETYRTLARIMSLCCENAEVFLATEIDPRELRAANSSHSRQAIEEASCEQVVGDFRSTESGDSATRKDIAGKGCLGMTSFGDELFHETDIILDDIILDDINQMMTLERSGDASNGQRTSEARSQSVHRGNHPTEFEHSMEENEVIVHDNNTNTSRTSDHKNVGNHQLSPETQAHIDDNQQVIVESGGSIVEKLPGTIFSSDGDKIWEVSMPNEHNQETELVDKHQLPENQPIELEAKDIVCEHDSKVSHVPCFEVMEVEDGEQCSEKVFKVDLMDVDKNMSWEDHEKSNNTDDKAPMVVDTSKENHEMLLRDMQTDELAYILETIVPPDCMTENEDVEEGEICGDDGVADGSASTILEEQILLEERVGDIQVSEDRINGKKVPAIEVNGNGKRPVSFPEMAEYASHKNEENKEDFKQIKSNLVACERRNIVSGKLMRSEKGEQEDFMLEERGYKIMDSENENNTGSFAAYFSNQVVHDQVPNAYAAGCKEEVSTEKETEVSNKKKRGPLSEEKKAKKKLKERKKRAEKNRKLGVKRLKLHPVTMPKPVVYCRHYLKGRCHEGDKCKFSHDTIPLTKSTPCSHFARHSCMKGDDCPFDHQLSKYPCLNFASKGFCSRGDACLFSHKVLHKEESISTPNSKTEPKTPVLPGNSNSESKLKGSCTLKQNLVAVPNYTGTSRHNTPESEILPKKTTGPPPHGINFLSFGTPSAASSKIKVDHLSQEKNSKEENSNVLNQGRFCVLGSSNELPRKNLPETVPKGINFLSFGKTSQNDSNNKKLGTPSSYEDGVKPSQVDSSNLAMSQTGPNTIDLQKKVEEASSKQMNILFPKASVGNYVPDGSVSPSSKGKVSSDLPVQTRKKFHCEGESSSAMSSRLSGTPISSGQFSDSLASSVFKGRLSSVQKAVLSTLEFAANYESLITKNKGTPLQNNGGHGGMNENINKSFGSPAVSNEGNNEGRNGNICGSLKSDQEKASKLLDFLLGVRDKS